MVQLFPSYKVAYREYLHSDQDVCRAKTSSKASWARTSQKALSQVEGQAEGSSGTMILQGRLCTWALQVAISKTT